MKKSTEEINCSRGCCSIFIQEYTRPFKFHREPCRKKAGICLHDTVQNKILIVQSCGKFWGIPKGTLKPNEMFVTGAIREVKEETGLDISHTKFTKYVQIDSATYYYVEMNVCPVEVQDEMQDANGISWINLDCLDELVRAKKIELNSHCKTVLWELIGWKSDYEMPRQGKLTLII